jgi:predicted nucleic acid-binding protein
MRRTIHFAYTWSATILATTPAGKDAAGLPLTAQQPMAGLFTTTVTQAEIFYGLALPQGRRRDDLVVAAQQMFDVDLTGRVLPFDIDAAMIYAEIAAGRRRIGKPISQIDAQIAAVVRSRGAQLATRNVPDFVDCGIVVVNPWGT